MPLSLTAKHCLPCEGGVAPLNVQQAKELLKQVPRWGMSDDGKKISRTFKFKNFGETRAFFNTVANIADSEGHHPDFEVSWAKCTLTLWTHAIGGLSENDFIVAAKIDGILCNSPFPAMTTGVVQPRPYAGDALACAA